MNYPRLDNAVEECAEYLANKCHGAAKDAGWWNKKPDIPRMLMLCVSELSEAMEGDRKDLMDDHLPHRKMFEVELADTLIRVFDMAGGLGLDIGGAMAEKLEYNKSRADHKLDNRNKSGGKKY